MLASAGLWLRTGPFVAHVRSRIPSVGRGIQALYGDFPWLQSCDFADFHVELRAPYGIRRWYQPQVYFISDSRSVFRPLPYPQAFPMLEWGLNWCVANLANHYLMFHAAAVAKDDHALILPAPPGSGKSTLCAGLVCRGWRLLSDETTLVDLSTGMLQGLARPISLKNASIGVIRDFAPEAFLNEPCFDTLKGTVAHMRPPRNSVDRVMAPAKPTWLVFPRYQAGAVTALTPRGHGDAFMALAGNAFNYRSLGRVAFEATADLVDQCRTFDFMYSALDEAIEVFDELACRR